ncbi:hypothetical protein [Verrucomicrobium sp. BvORR106]|uniref:hypothetical protein n=1 Tax=Verrucomicrobium sp. BvORR106 TaxID=1403819 RepID=UPI00056F94E3|nr:hypothetical protein [Verrucomicrobium sp. BvORR106]
MKPIALPSLAFCISLALPLLVASCSSLATSTSKNKNEDKNPTPMVSKLTPGQSIEVQFQSSGCFHYVKHHLKIVPQGDGYLVTGTSPLTSSPRQPKNERAKASKLHDIRLTQSDAVKLDRLFEFYRHVRAGGCTTSDTISLQVKSGTKTVSQATFKDETCDTYDRPELLTIPKLVSRMQTSP